MLGTRTNVEVVTEEFEDVRDHLEIANVAEVIDQDQEVEIDQVGVGDVPDPGKGRKEKKDVSEKRKDYRQSKRDICQVNIF